MKSARAGMNAAVIRTNRMRNDLAFVFIDGFFPIPSENFLARDKEFWQRMDF